MDLTTLRDITESELHRVRKQDGRIAIHDVIRAVTGQQLKACRTTLHRFKFNESGRACNQQTPATNAQGIVAIIMCMSGKAA